MSRRKGSVVEFFDGFNSAYSTVNKVLQDKEIRDIVNAKPEASQGYTADQGADLEAAAKSGQYDIGIKTKDDGTFDSYTVTSKADPSQTGAIAQQGVTDFLGKRTAGEMTAEQQDSARMRAMGGVLKKYGDPMSGLMLEQKARQGEREDKRFGWEEKRAGREDDAAQREDTWRKGREQLFQDSHFGQIQRANSDAKSKYGADLAEYNRRVQAGETGLTAPAQPEAKAYGYGQSLLDHLCLAAHDVQYGKAGAETLTKLAQMQKDFTDEGYAKALKLAHGGAPIEEVAKIFNASGKVKLDPASLVGDKMVDMGNGIKSRVFTFKNPDGSTTSINTLSELDALDKADKLVDRVFKANADTRADKSLGLQQAQTGASVAHLQAQTGVLNQNLSDKKELGEIRTTLNSAIESGDEAAIKTQRAKMMNYMMSGKSGMQQMAPEERKANFYLASGMAPTMADAARMAHEKVQTSAKDDYMALMKPNSMGMVPSAEQVEPVMSAMHGADWKGKLSSAKPTAAGKPKDQSDAHSQAQAAVKGGASKDAVNKRLKQLGFAPLP